MSEINITLQQAVADNILSKIRLVDPGAILAGGAPRDWYLGYTANDLDFYFCSTGMTAGAVKKQLKAVGVENVESSSDFHTTELYSTMEGLVRIWNTEVSGTKVQLIQLDTPQNRWQVVDRMDVSVCKVWYLNGHINLHSDFKLTLASGVMFLSDKYCWANKHGQKMLERFKGKFVAGTKEQAKTAIVNKALLEI